MMPRETLGPFEFQIVSLLAQQPHGSYGAALAELLRERGREPSLGALYTTLERLEAKGYVSSSWGDATPERGGRRKRMFRLEAAGVYALTRTQAVMSSFAPVFPGARPVEA